MPLVLILLAALLSGCATPYIPYGIRGGYSEVQLSENEYLVRFTASNFTPAERARDYVLLRSAEVSMRGDSSHFLITSSEDARSTTVMRTGSAEVTPGGGGGYVGAVSDSTRVNLAPGYVLRIRTLDEKREGALNARMVATSIRNKYKLRSSPDGAETLSFVATANERPE